MQPPLPDFPVPYVELPRLRDFAARFHQDWGEEADDDSGIIRLHLEESSPEEVALLRAEIDYLLSLQVEEDAMRALFWSYGCEYNPIADGLTTTEWVRSVRDRLG